MIPARPFALVATVAIARRRRERDALHEVGAPEAASRRGAGAPRCRRRGRRPGSRRSTLTCAPRSGHGALVVRDRRGGRADAGDLADARRVAALGHVQAPAGRARQRRPSTRRSRRRAAVRAARDERGRAARARVPPDVAARDPVQVAVRLRGEVAVDCAELIPGCVVVSSVVVARYAIPAVTSCRLPPAGRSAITMPPVSGSCASCTGECRTR